MDFSCPCHSSSSTSGFAVCFLILLPTPGPNLCLPAHRLSCLVTASSLSSSGLCSNFYQGFIRSKLLSFRVRFGWAGLLLQPAVASCLGACLLGQPFGRDRHVQGKVAILLSRQGLCLEVNAATSSPACASRFSLLQQYLKLNSPPNQLPHWVLC